MVAAAVRPGCRRRCLMVPAPVRPAARAAAARGTVTAAARAAAARRLPGAAPAGGAVVAPAGPRGACSRGVSAAGSPPVCPGAGTPRAVRRSDHEGPQPGAVDEPAARPARAPRRGGDLIGTAPVDGGAAHPLPWEVGRPGEPGQGLAGRHPLLDQLLDARCARRREDVFGQLAAGAYRRD